MSLSAALDLSRSALAAFAGQSAVAARNIANAGNPDASRKLAPLVTGPGGGVALAPVGRAAEERLLDAVLAASSAVEQRQAFAARLDRLDALLADPADGRSPAALIGKLRDALQTYAAQPDQATLATAAVSRAVAVAGSLNAMSSQVQDIRLEADRELTAAVATLNARLAEFEDLDARIVAGTARGQDVTDLLDRRDVVLVDISAEIGVSIVRRPGNAMALYTDGGITLFDGRARTVSIEPTNFFTAATVGADLVIDGVRASGAASPMPVATGRIAGLIAVRDEVAVTFQAQLDEIARGLVEAFAETDQSGVGLAARPGLFTWPGAPALPSAGPAPAGLAAAIAVAAGVDPGAGGDVFRLRDGAVSGHPAYAYNATGAAGFSARIEGLVEAVEASRPFDPGAGLGPTATLVGFAADSAGWLAGRRAEAAGEADHHGALFASAREALANAAGVNLDDEMARLLEVERSYEATARLIATVDRLFDALLGAVR